MNMGLETMAPDLRGTIGRTFAALEGRGVHAVFVADRDEALRNVLELIPKGSAVAHGTSTTLQEIGFVESMKHPDSGYRYLNLEWQTENDATKRGRLRARLSAEADVFLGSIQAICETGEVVGCDASGSRQAPCVYGPAKVIWVAGINKIVGSLEEGMRRARTVALPLEDRRIRSTGGKGSYIGKLVIYEQERSGRTTLVLVGEPLGF